MRFATITLAFGLALPIALAFLQVFLSRRESRWPGLLLPAVSLLLSAVIGLGNVAYTTVAATSNGSQTVLHDPGAPVAALAIFLIANIPTLVYLVIYFACREGARRRKEVQRMNVQDL